MPTSKPEEKQAHHKLNFVKPFISIIIPTHNRQASLLRTLQSLSSQTLPAEQFEVIVVADGCTDDTISAITNYTSGFQLSFIEQSGQGPAVARNAGAKKAVGSILIFIDDDIEAAPGFVEAHLEAHQQVKDRVVIGYLPPVIHGKKGFFSIKLRQWWEDMFQVMRHKAYQFSYRNLTSGNFSIHKELYIEVNGFDENFKCQEDYELGLRLIKISAQFVFAPDAMGYHHEVTDLNRSLNRKLNEGKAAILFCKKHPQLISTLPLLNRFARNIPAHYKRMMQLQCQWPTLADGMANAFKLWLTLLEKLRMRKRWQRTLDRLLTYWYLRGVTASVENLEALKSILANNSTSENDFKIEIEVDLADGIIVAEEKVDVIRPTSIKILFDKQLIGYINHKSGYERLKSIHLRFALAEELAYPLMQAVALDKLSDSSGPFENIKVLIKNKGEINGHSGTRVRVD